MGRVAAELPAGDLAASICTARAEAARYADADPEYAETMATYAELGELLAAGGPDETFVDDARDLAERLVFLHRAAEVRAAQWWALWCVRHQAPGNGAVA